MNRRRFLAWLGRAPAVVAGLWAAGEVAGGESETIWSPEIDCPGEELVYCAQVPMTYEEYVQYCPAIGFTDWWRRWVVMRIAFRRVPGETAFATVRLERCVDLEEVKRLGVKWEYDECGNVIAGESEIVTEPTLVYPCSNEASILIFRCGIQEPRTSDGGMVFPEHLVPELERLARGSK